jgi:predicted Zn-dependent protease
MGAEARYCLADIAFQEDKLDDAHDEISGLLKMKPKYNYWVAKGLILRSRVYMNENNLFQAESDLKSIQQHYPISDDGIIDQANQYWDELMQLKNVSKEIEEAEEKTIEIDEE